MQSSAPNDLLKIKSTSWKTYSCEEEQTRDEQTAPRLHASHPYKVCPLSLMFWDNIGVDKRQFVHIRPPRCSKSRAAT